MSNGQWVRPPAEMCSALYSSSSDWMLLAVATVSWEILAQFCLATGPYHRKGGKKDKLSFKNFHGSFCREHESTDMEKILQSGGCAIQKTASPSQTCHRQERTSCAGSLGTF